MAIDAEAPAPLRAACGRGRGRGKSVSAGAMQPTVIQTLVSALHALRKEISGGCSINWISKMVSAVGLLQVFAKSSTKLIVASDRSFQAVLGHYRASAGCLVAMGYVEMRRRGKKLYAAGSTRGCLRARSMMSTVEEVLAIYNGCSTNGFRADEVARRVADMEAEHKRKYGALRKFRTAGQAVVAQVRSNVAYVCGSLA
eukprot:COSAG05_NODE_1066_length_5973_cov_116.687606_3_plen_199_part_00